ncbi:MAG: LysR family transcriptional regulator [Acetobacteraceae bacterium]|nr:LysR family transcriptional regulator [Pseudomonadota bacterium]
MDLPTLRQLRTFIAAVELGSITQAARTLHMTQPAASQQLRELERILGARLFDRAEGRVIPTSAGAAILEPARRSQAAVADVAAFAAMYRSGEAGRVRLGTGATACIYLLPSVLAAAKRRMPGLEIVVATGNTPEILRRIEEGELDVGLVTLPARVGRALSRTALLRDPLVALVPESLGGAGSPLAPAQVAALPLILFETAGDTRRIVDDWFGRSGLAPKPIMELGSVEAIKVLVGSGLGASVLPHLALREAVPGAVTRPLRPALARDLGLVLRREKVLDRGLRVFVEELKRIASATRRHET